MFERFTDSARRTVVLAQEESRRLAHGFIGSEHLLLGIAAAQQQFSDDALAGLGSVTNLGVLRAALEGIRPEGDSPSPGSIPFTPRAKKILELSLREAMNHGHSYIGLAHLMLGLLAAPPGVAVEMLVSMGQDPAALHQQISEAMPPGGHRGPVREPVDLAGQLGSLEQRLAELTRQVAELSEQVAELHRRVDDDPED